MRDLAERATDPFIKTRLLDLAARYEDDGPEPTNRTPIDLQFKVEVPGPSGKGRWLSTR